ncbi:MAG: hypothetical protein AVDCRST_MAG66-3440 [uncultured Pseudonocardia sp.]|uniref:Uncharacterized protein n=1 Tax=uncultured Pseudonocardia sp. TaxID=211455 RepID=A0A6J4QBE5_9PSEU|nr:MAG: hypothetical protein AVDCRST_MAG66-3440 [uncultured Pseudonocardia sp.]
MRHNGSDRCDRWTVVGRPPARGRDSTAGAVRRLVAAAASLRRPCRSSTHAEMLANHERVVVVGVEHLQEVCDESVGSSQRHG